MEGDHIKSYKDVSGNLKINSGKRELSCHDRIVAGGAFIRSFDKSTTFICKRLYQNILVDPRDKCHDCNGAGSE